MQKKKIIKEYITLRCNYFINSLTSTQSLEPIYEMVFSNSEEQTIAVSTINQKHPFRESISINNVGCIPATMMCFQTHESLGKKFSHLISHHFCSKMSHYRL